MTDLTLLDGGREIERFDPERYRLKQAALDYGIEEAKQIKDWPALEHAVDLKIEEQRHFVAWWRANVTPARNLKLLQGPVSRDLGERDRMSGADAERVTGMKHQRVSDLSNRLMNSEKYREHLLGAEFCAAFLTGIDNVRGTQGTGENEWFTPAEYIERARTVLGGIDLDPATHDAAQEVVKAEKYFTKEDDGLSLDWHGRVWLNPPYAQPLIAQFVSKMVAERLASHVTAAIMLTHNYTDTEWFHEAATTADAICFTRGRVKFYSPDGAVAAPTQGQAFFYFGSNVRLFTAQFKSVGFVVRP